MTRAYQVITGNLGHHYGVDYVTYDVEELKVGHPQVVGAHEFLEITRDFTNPREAIREAISNSIDWCANEIRIKVYEDRKRPDEELILEISDNGLGLDEERLRAFFDLGHTIRSTSDSDGHPLNKIGYKGHGTKTYFNSRQIEIRSNSSKCAIYALMDSPLQKLMLNQIPEYKYQTREKDSGKNYTSITIRGYNTNKNKQDFGHKVLKDYILWVTRFGSVEKEFKIFQNKDTRILLQGLGQENPETIQFGHRFPKENCDIDRLERQRPSDWTKVFVKRWLCQKRQVIDFPGKFIDMVFYVEGDEAKRSYNQMIRVRGRTPEYGMYKVEDRYGLWVCRDYIPIKKYNEWLGLGRRFETKYHAFVNCQDFMLIANRTDIGNTPPDLLNKIAETVRQIYENEIIGSTEYQEYEEAAELEQQYQTAAQERKDFDRRSKRVKTKKVCDFKNVELIEPGIEMGVVSLFSQVYALGPRLFPFRIVDYDTRRGYDALVVHTTPFDLSKDSMSFIEFKYMLTPEFNHSFDHLFAVVCWDCDLSEGAIVRDIGDKSRELHITTIGDGSDYTRFMLTSTRERHNIEVFVLKHFLKEKLKVEFLPRAKSSAAKRR